MAEKRKSGPGPSILRVKNLGPYKWRCKEKEEVGIKKIGAMRVIRA